MCRLTCFLLLDRSLLENSSLAACVIRAVGRGRTMKRSKFSEAQIAFILRQGEEGTAVGEICRKAGISEATYYNWRKSTGGPSQPFLTTQYALSSLSELGTSEGDFIARHSSRVMYVYPQAGPPHPSRPLHCEHGNSLAVLIPLLLLRRPKRIFIFGADGGSNPVFNKRPYFYNEDIDL